MQQESMQQHLQTTLFVSDQIPGMELVYVNAILLLGIACVMTVSPSPILHKGNTYIVMVLCLLRRLDSDIVLTLNAYCNIL